MNTRHRSKPLKSALIVLALATSVTNVVHAESAGDAFRIGFERVGGHTLVSPNIDYGQSSQILRGLEAEAKTVSDFRRGELFRGGVDTGGGTIINTPEGTGLLDLYLYNQPAFLDQTVGDKLPETTALKAIGIDRMDLANLPVVQKARQHLLRWRPSSPLLVPDIENALKELPLFYLAGKMSKSAEAYTIPKGMHLDTKSLRMGAIYISEFGVFISKAEFEALSEKNQIALLIHESLRHMQLTLGSLMSNESIQIVTAQIMRGPKPGESLDTAPNLQGPLLEMKLQELKVSADILKTAIESCAMATLLCDVDASDSSRTIAKLNEAYEEISRRLGSSKLSRQEYEKLCLIRNDLDVHFIVLNHLELAKAVKPLESSALMLGRFSKFGLLDIGLTDVNKRGWFRSNYRESLLGLKFQLVNLGLMSSK